MSTSGKEKMTKLRTKLTLHINANLDNIFPWTQHQNYTFLWFIHLTPQKLINGSSLNPSTLHISVVHSSGTSNADQGQYSTIEPINAQSDFQCFRQLLLSSQALSLSPLLHFLFPCTTGML